MTHHRGERGATLMELLVALLIFSLAAAGWAQTLAVAQRARRTSEHWMRATQLAGDLMERLRAGTNTPPSASDGRFTSSWRTAPVADIAGLSRLEVTIEWTDVDTNRFVLTGLISQAP
jgi:prepilin-type N-terminal cleavage/methylation domain-containing protein